MCKDNILSRRTSFLEMFVTKTKKGANRKKFPTARAAAAWPLLHVRGLNLRTSRPAVFGPTSENDFDFGGATACGETFISFRLRSLVTVDLSFSAVELSDSTLLRPKALL